MKRLLRASTFILLTASALGLGVVGVRASTECERFIRVVVNRRVPHHKVSSDTLARWVAWNKAHPNYHPRKLSPKETWEKVNFACEVPMLKETAALELPPIAPPQLELPPDLFPPEAPHVEVTPFPPTVPVEPSQPTEALLVPAAFAPGAPTPLTVGAVVPPAVLPATPPVTAATPEPGSFLLMGTAVLSLSVLALRRRCRTVRG